MIPPQELILEACLETPEEAHSAFLNGAHRVELCRNLESGGLSPSRETVRHCLEICELPLKVMVRPRPGNFVYSEEELTSMETEIDSLKKLLSQGLYWECSRMIEASTCKRSNAFQKEQTPYR